MTGRAERRSHEARAKDKAARFIERLWDPAWGKLSGADKAKRVGKMAAVHNRPCSCVSCGNARRHFGAKTLKEISHEEQADNQMLDLP